MSLEPTLLKSLVTIHCRTLLRTEKKLSPSQLSRKLDEDLPKIIKDNTNTIDCINDLRHTTGINYNSTTNEFIFTNEIPHVKIEADTLSYLKMSSLAKTKEDIAATLSLPESVDIILLSLLSQQDIVKCEMKTPDEIRFSATPTSAINLFARNPNVASYYLYGVGTFENTLSQNTTPFGITLPEMEIPIPKNETTSTPNLTPSSIDTTLTQNYTSFISMITNDMGDTDNTINYMLARTISILEENSGETSITSLHNQLYSLFSKDSQYIKTHLTRILELKTDLFIYESNRGRGNGVSSSINTLVTLKGTLSLGSYIQALLNHFNRNPFSVFEEDELIDAIQATPVQIRKGLAILFLLNKIYVGIPSDINDPPIYSIYTPFLSQKYPKMLTLEPDLSFFNFTQISKFSPIGDPDVWKEKI